MSTGEMAVLAVGADVTRELDTVLGWMAWLVTCAGVAGLIIVGTRMALAVKTGDAEEHLREFLTVMGACVIGASAGPLVSFLLNG
ncbi:hypothetical protein EV562_106168 [Streptomyces sp. BK208]|uniref:hypothetical protein n=1 Tax=Streptomyces sp. BK208 TaxID=2512150 RepID=UPI00105BD543|nr:hypothetical protein [Streptomyces sp. BK208]TDT37392.1 hypothetical protein EV562_106168 [Streptomyces sp. BK208]